MIKHPKDSAAYFWNAKWSMSSEFPGSDVSHGSHVIAYIVEAVEYGTEWKADDIAKFITLFDKILWPEPGVYASYVDGSLGNVSISRANDGWAKLGRYNVDLQHRLEEGHEPSIPPNNKTLSSQYYGTGALNAHILLDSTMYELR